MEDQKLVDKISSLGGFNRIDKKVRYVGETKFAFNSDSQLPNNYLEIGKRYNSFSFTNWVKVKLLEDTPISDEGYVDVECFYEKDDAYALKSNYFDQLPIDLLPIFSSFPGDLICLNLSSKQYGKVYYWDHEGPSGSDTFLIAHSFDEFVLKLEVEDEEETDSKPMGKITKVTMTKEFLDLLKKDGYGPKDDSNPK
ncbi:MAG: hypothetical protein BGO54_21845 [Sphingobacteriales bacterium 46-32]|nr:MAG: hypothetical protein BGO54_21845 [Sphingobacteriales bacterium 46-32]